MIRILIFIIIISIALPALYFLATSGARKKRMLIFGGAAIAAMAGIFMQLAFPLYLSLLGILGISLIATLIYMKVLEQEQLMKQQMLEERRARKTKVNTRDQEFENKAVEKAATTKPFGMQTIAASREEQKVGQ